MAPFLVISVEYPWNQAQQVFWSVHMNPGTSIRPINVQCTTSFCTLLSSYMSRPQLYLANTQQLNTEPQKVILGTFDSISLSSL